MDPQIAKRIEQFEKMSREDPENEMAHFSLGNAYSQAERHADAAASFSRVTELAPHMSKAYQLAAESLLASGDEQKAGDLALEGYLVAAENGDFKPKEACEEILKRLGRDVPKVEVKQAPAGAGGFVCGRTGRPGTKMARPPFRGPIGEWIQQNISQETFNEWILQGTKVINELRLDLSREEDAQTYDEHMYEYLGVEEGVLKQTQAK